MNNLKTKLKILLQKFQLHFLFMYLQVFLRSLFEHNCTDHADGVDDFLNYYLLSEKFLSTQKYDS